MIIEVKDETYSPENRRLEYIEPANQIPQCFVTLGSCSYIVGGKMNILEWYNGHLLVGKFSSLSWGLSFDIGHNHVYKNVVTTYPFETADRFKSFLERNHPYDLNSVPKLRTRDNKFQIIIGHDVWIGHDAKIFGGVKIGTGAIIGSNSVVAKDIPPYAVAVGNPAKVVKYRFRPEVIKKLSAIKWWNWELDKILANLPKMYDVENFLAEHYTPELEIFPDDEISEQVKNFRAAGKNVYAFVADFRVNKPLWKRIVKGFCNSNSQNAALIIFLPPGTLQSDADEVQKLFDETKKAYDNPLIICSPARDGKNFSVPAIRNATHFLMTRESVSLECTDFLHDTDVKIISAFDDGIFDGEPSCYGEGSELPIYS